MTKIYWSKWGGARASIEEKLDQWSCQSCGKLQFTQIGQFPVRNEFNEVFRICVLCRKLQVSQSYTSIHEIIAGVRKFDVITYVENLATVPLRW